MRIRSISQLNEFLDDELRWRKRELTTLKFLVTSSRPHQRSLLVRVGICLLYAHWEGFVKSAATSYVSLVAHRGLRYSDLTPNFVALGLRSEILTAGRSNRATIHTALAERLLLGLSDTARIEWEDAIDTRSNLNSDSLTEILCALGIDGSSYLTKGPIIDQKLLGQRNIIAHGGQLEMAEEDYTSLHEDVIRLVEQFKTDVENAAVLIGYIRTT